jgi:hypothetical protein
VRWLVALAAFLALVGCQRSPVRAPTAGAPAAAPSLAELRSEAAALAARGDHEGAAARYRVAVERAPDDVALRYLYAVTRSHLDRRAETIEHFGFVVARGRPDSEEVAIARTWLAQNGAEGGAPATAATAPAAGAAAADATPTIGRVKGRTEWTGVDPAARRLTVRIELGRDGEPRGPRTRLRHFVFGQPYEFAAVAPGRYRLTAMVEGVPLWDQVITAEAGKDTVLDLTAANSVNAAGAAQAFGTRSAASR